MYTIWQWGIFHYLEFVCAWFYALFGKSEAKVRHFLASDNALLKVYFNVMLHKSV
jgi:hypothetical protein